MDPHKKPYAAPRLIVYGKVEEITRLGGTSITDVPQGGIPLIDDVISSIAS